MSNSSSPVRLTNGVRGAFAPRQLRPLAPTPLLRKGDEKDELKYWQQAALDLRLVMPVPRTAVQAKPCRK